MVPVALTELLSAPSHILVLYFSISSGPWVPLTQRLLSVLGFFTLTSLFPSPIKLPTSIFSFFFTYFCVWGEIWALGKKRAFLFPVLNLPSVSKLQILLSRGRYVCNTLKDWAILNEFDKFLNGHIKTQGDMRWHYTTII